jgi:predicted Rossmann fold nucleotide-binding protein DprA/Smf involved in DNA uptake
MLQTSYTRDCMIKRNRYMVDRSRYVLAVWDGSNGGTGYTVRYARSQNRIVQIINPTEL